MTKRGQSAQSATERLVEALERLEAHVLAVRTGSGSAGDDVANVLEIVVGTGKHSGLADEALTELGASWPTVPLWGEDIAKVREGSTVEIGLRGAPDPANSRGPLPAFLAEDCLRLAIPGTDPHRAWSYLELTRYVRDTAGSHAGRQPKWLEQLRLSAVADSDPAMFVLWCAAEVTLVALTTLLHGHGVDVDVFVPESEYLDGVLIRQMYVCTRDEDVTLDAQVKCAPGQHARRVLAAANSSHGPILLGVSELGTVATQNARSGQSIDLLVEEFRLGGRPKVGRNERCPCGRDRKFKHCCGR